MSHRLYEDHITLVVWPGPEHHIPYSELDALPEPQPGAVTATPRAEAVEVDATKGARELAAEHDIDLADYYRGERLTYYDVQDIIEGEGHDGDES